MTLRSLLAEVFTNNKGQIVVWQKPNLPLLGWIICKLSAAVFQNGVLHTGFQLLGEALILVWAFLEIRTGASVFRRILGAAIMIFVIYGFLSHG